MTFEWLRTLVQSVAVSPGSQSETRCDTTTSDNGGHSQPALEGTSHLSHSSHQQSVEFGPAPGDGALPLVACADCVHFDWRPAARPDAFCGKHRSAVASVERRECGDFERPGVERRLWDTSCGACIVPRQSS